LDTDKSESPIEEPGVSLLNLLAAADKLERLLYQEMAETVRLAAAVIADDHPDWRQEQMAKLLQSPAEDRSV
jgi:hypothetical protein